MNDLFFGNNYHFGLGRIHLASGKEFPSLCIAKTNGDGGRVGELTENTPSCVDNKGEENLIFVFHNRAGLRALLDHLREVDDTWERQGWPSDGEWVALFSSDKAGEDSK